MPRRVIGASGLVTLVPRNPVARSPLLRKGGVHEESKKDERRNAKQALEQQLGDWRDDLDFERSLKADEDSAYL